MVSELGTLAITIGNGLSLVQHGMGLTHEAVIIGRGSTPCPGIFLPLGDWIRFARKVLGQSWTRALCPDLFLPAELPSVPLKRKEVLEQIRAGRPPLDTRAREIMVNYRRWTGQDMEFFHNTNRGGWSLRLVREDRAFHFVELAEICAMIVRDVAVQRESADDCFPWLQVRREQAPAPPAPPPRAAAPAPSPPQPAATPKAAVAQPAVSAAQASPPFPKAVASAATALMGHLTQVIDLIDRSAGEVPELQVLLLSMKGLVVGIVDAMVKSGMRPAQVSAAMLSGQIEAAANDAKVKARAELEVLQRSMKHALDQWLIQEKSVIETAHETLRVEQQSLHSARKALEIQQQQFEEDRRSLLADHQRLEADRQQLVRDRQGLETDQQQLAVRVGEIEAERRRLLGREQEIAAAIESDKEAFRKEQKDWRATLDGELAELDKRKAALDQREADLQAQRQQLDSILEAHGRAQLVRVRGIKKQ